MIDLNITYYTLERFYNFISLRHLNLLWYITYIVSLQVIHAVSLHPVYQLVDSIILPLFSYLCFFMKYTIFWIKLYKKVIFPIQIQIIFYHRTKQTIICLLSNIKKAIHLKVDRLFVRVSMRKLKLIIILFLHRMHLNIIV